MPAELYNKLLNNMRSICSRYEGSKTISYGLRVKVSAVASLTDDDGTCKVNLDIYFSGCTATEKWQIQSAANEAKTYQREQMQKIYNELESTVKRLFSEYHYYEEFNYSVEPGYSETHE